MERVNKKVCFCLLYFFLSTSLSRTDNLCRLTGKAQQTQEQRYPFLSVCAAYSCVKTKAWLPVLGICNVRTDVDACDCTGGLYGHRKRVCVES